MSNNALKKPVLLQSAATNQPQMNTFGPTSALNSSASAVPSVSVQNPQNVYFIYGNPTIPMTSSAPATAADSSEREQRLEVLEGRVSTAVEKFEKMIKTQEEKAKVSAAFGQPLPFSFSTYRPSSAGGFGTQRNNLFANPTPAQPGFTFSSRSFERPFWFGSNNSQNSFANTKNFFEQRPHPYHGMNIGKSECPMNPNVVKLMPNRKENNLDIIDGIAKPPNGHYSLRDMSDDENE